MPETIMKIRLAARSSKKPIRQTVRDFGLSRNTVRKVRRGDKKQLDYHRWLVRQPQVGHCDET